MSGATFGVASQLYPAYRCAHAGYRHRHGRACPGHPRLCSIASNKTWMPATSAGNASRNAPLWLLLEDVLAIDRTRHSRAEENPMGRQRAAAHGAVPNRRRLAILHAIVPHDGERHIWARVSPRYGVRRIGGRSPAFESGGVIPIEPAKFSRRWRIGGKKLHVRRELVGPVGR